MNKITLVSICMLTVCLNAKPVYLSCSVDRINNNPSDKKATIKSTMKLDEDINMVMFSTDVISFKINAFFYPDSIQFTSDIEDRLIRTVEINRETLGMYMKLQIVDPNIDFISDPTYFKGQCKVVQKKNKI